MENPAGVDCLRGAHGASFARDWLVEEAAFSFYLAGSVWQVVCSNAFEPGATLLGEQWYHSLWKVAGWAGGGVDICMCGPPWASDPGHACSACLCGFCVFSPGCDSLAPVHSITARAWRH